MLREWRGPNLSHCARVSFFRRVRHAGRLTGQSRAWNQFARNCGETSASARSNEKSESDRNQIFANSDNEVVNVQISHQTFPCLVSDKRADHAACSSQQRSEK